MDRADGNRKMWLLKSTSGHNRPECLAAALALGVLAGLVPKLNLLAVILYALILVLPVHTLLAVGVSVGVAMLSVQCDGLAHAIGQWLLRQASLRPLWTSLERVPLVPWMSLHNTVVLGHMVMGTILLAPIYMLSLRVFERVEYGRSRKFMRSAAVQAYAPVTTEETEPLTTKKEVFPERDGSPDHRRSELPRPQESTVDLSPLIIPPPKLHRPAAQTTSRAPLTAPDEPILFEPVDEVQQRINAWHMHRAAGDAQFAINNASRSPTSESASATPTGQRLTSVASIASDTFYPQMMQARVSDDRGMSDREIPPAPKRPSGEVDSVQLAQNASDVLAWVDDLLDECMAAEGMTLVTQNLEPAIDVHAQSVMAEADVDEVGANERSTQPRWLLETTIEIVRLTDETMSDHLLVAEQPMDCQAQANLSEPRSMENSKVMPADSMMRAWPSVGSVATASGAMATPLPVQDEGEPTILNLNQVTGRGQGENRTGFQQLVMAGVNKIDQPRAAAPIEPVKGECLAYLLGHLRQSREGKST